MYEKRYDTDVIKDWLIDYRETERDIDNQNERLDKMIIRLEGVGAFNLSDMPRSATPDYDRNTRLIEDKIELEQYIKHLTESQKQKKKLIEQLLLRLRKADEKAVIRSRYLDLSEWEDVNMLLFGGLEDFFDREDSYMRRTHKLHASALYNIAVYVSEHPIGDIPSPLL